MPTARDASRDDTSHLAMCIPVRCPQCREPGLVHLTRLQNGMKCPACDCHFIVGRDGQIRRVADLPHVRYSCPRCHQAGLVPAPLAARTAKCPHCRLPLARGPDHKLYGADEAAEMWRQNGGKTQRLSWSDRFGQFVTASDGRLRKQCVAAMALPAVVALWLAAWGLKTLLDFSLETRAAAFTYACLVGEEDGVLEYLEDDAVQYVELKRWIRRFASILDRHRPAGDRVRVDVETVDSRPGRRVLLVTVRSEFLGARRHIQHWRQRNSRWLFDSLATLADEQGPPAARRAAPNGVRPKRAPNGGPSTQRSPSQTRNALRL